MNERKKGSGPSVDYPMHRGCGGEVSYSGICQRCESEPRDDDVIEPAATRPKKGADINWIKVEQVMVRGKLGLLRHGDEELIERAFKVDRKKYGELSRRVNQEVADEVKKKGFY